MQDCYDLISTNGQHCFRTRLLDFEEAGGETEDETVTIRPVIRLSAPIFKRLKSEARATRQSVDGFISGLITDRFDD